VYSDYDPTLFRVAGDDPLSASVSLFRRTSLSRPVALNNRAWGVRIETEARMTCDKEFFHISATQRAYQGEDLVHSREYGAAIPRDHG
jgi:hypothetical protein